MQTLTLLAIVLALHTILLTPIPIKVFVTVLCRGHAHRLGLKAGDPASTWSCCSGREPGRLFWCLGWTESTVFAMVLPVEWRPILGLGHHPPAIGGP